ncbi:MAG: PAS domain S-box protein [Candidatus Magnetominusculus sp. LBB02]|nr:PAS domain S-box protein [Candidatus Magnetominusculus sp. LBB02]
MYLKIILISSCLVQLTAAALSFRLIRVTGRSGAWFFLAAGMSVMAIRRLLSLVDLFYNNVAASSYMPRPLPETAALLSSLLILIGIMLVAPVFHNVRTVERRKAKEVFQRLDNIVELIDDAVFGVDIAGRITHWNMGAEYIYGYSRAEIISSAMSGLFRPDEAGLAHEILNEVSQGSHIRNFETVHIRKDGRHVNVSLSVTPIAAVTSGTIEGASFIVRDITQRVHMVDSLKRSLNEKTLLLQEVHHRVKNNMQIISSLVYLQQGQISGDGLTEMFTAMQNRIKSMALIHEKLYQTNDLSKIDFGDYVHSLTENIRASYAKDDYPLIFDIDISDISLNIETAIPCGLIINELVSNSLKYAIDSDGKDAAVSISLKLTEDGSYVMLVRDNGAGMPADFDMNNTKTLGLKLVNTLVGHQLGGSLELRRGAGTEFKIKFSELVYNQRI